MYLHELLEDSSLHLPEVETPPRVSSHHHLYPHPLPPSRLFTSAASAAANTNVLLSPQHVSEPGAGRTFGEDQSQTGAGGIRQDDAERQHSGKSPVSWKQPVLLPVVLVPLSTSLGPVSLLFSKCCFRHLNPRRPPRK